MEPRMSCSHSRQSNEMDSVKRATSAAGPLANRPLRETGFFLIFKRAECAVNSSESHAGKGRVYEIPSSKHQINSKHQVPISGSKCLTATLVPLSGGNCWGLGGWNLFDVWCWGFEVFSASMPGTEDAA